MRMLAQRLPAILAFLLMAQACGDPCTDLAKKICKCEPTQTLQQACEQRVSNSGRGKPNDQEADVCDAKLETCTCASLAEGDLEACGLAEEDAS